MRYLISVLHYLCPFLVLAYTVLAPSEWCHERNMLLLWTSLLFFWLLFQHECPFGVLYKKMQDPAYIVGRNLRVPDLTDWYADLARDWGISTMFMHATFGSAMLLLGLAVVLRLSTFCSPQLPPTTIGAFFLSYVLVAFIGSARRRVWLSAPELCGARWAAGAGLAGLTALVCLDRIEDP